MGGSLNSSDDDVVSAINVTPLVDVVLVLLVIFMITAPALYQSALKVQLPQAKSGEAADTKEAAFNFTVSRTGELLWDNKSTTWERLAQDLIPLKDQLAQKTAIISADQGATHGDVVRLIDTLRQAGLTKFALNVASPQTQQ